MMMMMMQECIVLVLIASGAMAASTLNRESEIVHASYADNTAPDGEAKMDININTAEETIHFHMTEEGNMADVDTLEDYESGFAASRVEIEQSCYIRQLVDTIEVATAKARMIGASSPQQSEGEVKVVAIPAENAIEWAGERLTDFCGDYEVYKLMTPAEDDEAPEEEDANIESMRPDARVAVYFRKCWLFIFFYKCITTIITVPTGTFFIFFG